MCRNESEKSPEPLKTVKSGVALMRHFTVHENTVFGYIEASKPIGSQNMSVGGVLGFENYSTKFNLKNVKT